MSALTVAPLNVVGSKEIQPLEPLLTIEDVARIVGRSHWSLRNDVAAGKIKPIRLGRKLLFEPAEIRRFIEDARTASAAK